MTVRRLNLDAIEARVRPWARAITTGGPMDALAKDALTLLREVRRLTKLEDAMMACGCEECDGDRSGDDHVDKSACLLHGARFEKLRRRVRRVR